MPQTTETGPTLNKDFNWTLARWNAVRTAKGEPPHDPVCEECPADLTGKKVFQSPYNWLCESCYRAWKRSQLFVPEEPREDFHADL